MGIYLPFSGVQKNSLAKRVIVADPIFDSGILQIKDENFGDNRTLCKMQKNKPIREITGGAGGNKDNGKCEYKHRGWKDKRAVTT